MSGLPGVDGGYGEAKIEISPTGTRQMDNVSPGMQVTGAPGMKLHMGTPAVPNSEAANHFWQQISIVGCNLGLAPCQVLLDFSRENFVGYRGAIDEARKGFRANQKNLATRFHQPAYVQRVHYWANEDPRIKAQFARDKIKPLDHIWQVPAFKYVEPVNDAAGDSGDHGRRDRLARAQEAAERLNKKFSTDQFTWRDCINLPTADGIQVSLQSQPGKEPTAAGSKVGGKAIE